MPTQEFLPVWTEAPAKSTGRDHLGMQAPSITLYQELNPYLTNATLRVRYYSFYPWLCEQYARRRGSTSAKDWQIWVRRAEALFAISCCWVRDDHWCPGVAGVQWAFRTANVTGDGSSIDFEAAAAPGASERYLKAAYGAFGQAYSATLDYVGITRYVQQHPVPVPAVRWGDRLAAAFAQAVGSVGERFIELLESGVATTTNPRMGTSLTFFETCTFSMTRAQRHAAPSSWPDHEAAGRSPGLGLPFDLSDHVHVRPPVL